MAPMGGSFGGGRRLRAEGKLAFSTTRRRGGVTFAGGRRFAAGQRA